MLGLIQREQHYVVTARYTFDFSDDWKLDKILFRGDWIFIKEII